MSKVIGLVSASILGTFAISLDSVAYAVLAGAMLIAIEIRDIK